MQIVDLRGAKTITYADVATVSKDSDLNTHLLTKTGYLVILDQIEALKVADLYSGEKFKPKEEENRNLERNLME